MSVSIPPILVIDRALRDAGIPVDGVSIGDPLDRSTWHASYGPSATAAQRTQGNALLLTVDPQDATIVAELKSEMSAAVVQDMLLALGQAVWEAIPAPTMTLLQVRARAIALYKAKL